MGLGVRGRQHPSPFRHPCGLVYLGFDSSLLYPPPHPTPHGYPGPQDIEFTVQEGKLYMLQCRGGKRTGTAAVRIAVSRSSGGGVWGVSGAVRGCGQGV